MPDQDDSRIPDPHLYDEPNSEPKRTRRRVATAEPYRSTYRALAARLGVETEPPGGRNAPTLGDVHTAFANAQAYTDGLGLHTKFWVIPNLIFPWPPPQGEVSQISFHLDIAEDGSCDVNSYAGYVFGVWLLWQSARIGWALQIQRLTTFALHGGRKRSS